MRHYLDSIAAVLGLLLAIAVLAAAIAGGDYARAVTAEARGYDAWLGGARQAQGQSSAAGKTLLASNEVAQ